MQKKDEQMQVLDIQQRLTKRFVLHGNTDPEVSKHVKRCTKGIKEMKQFTVHTRL